MQLILGGGAALVAAAIWWWLVPQTRVADPEAPDFAACVTGPSTLAVAALPLLGSVALWPVPAAHWWLWVAYLACGAPLVVLDALTTFLPKRLHYLALGAMAVASLGLIAQDWRAWCCSAAGGVGAFLFLYVVYRLSPSLGFGDVRLAGLIGAVAGQSGPMAVLGALAVGTMIGAVHGVAHALWARRAPDRPAHFAYGPSLWAGPIVWTLFSGG